MSVFLLASLPPRLGYRKRYHAQQTSTIAPDQAPSEFMPKLNETLEVVLTTEAIQGVSVDLAETMLDLALDEGVLRDIPLVGSIVGIAKGACAIRDRIFAKKLLYMLTELKSVPLNERLAQVEKINKSAKYEINVGDKLIFLIDRTEDTRTASLIGMLFKLFLTELITYASFTSCSQVLNSSSIDTAKRECVKNAISLVSNSTIPEHVLSDYLSELCSLSTNHLLVLKWAVVRHGQSDNSLQLDDTYEKIMNDPEIEQSDSTITLKTIFFQLGSRHILDPTIGLNSNPDFPREIYPTQYAERLFTVFDLANNERLNINDVDAMLLRKAPA